MCYFVEINLTRQELEKRFGAKMPEHFKWDPYSFLSGFIFPQLPIIGMEDPGNFIPARWGLIPSWVKDETQASDIRKQTLNARAETIAEKPSFRNAYKRGRCVVPVSGFYEYHHQQKEKIPFYITLKDQPAFSLAGLYESWTNKATGEIILSVCIITTNANSLMEKIHNSKKRMPVILLTEDKEKWLDKNLSPAIARQCLTAITPEKMDAWPVKKEKIPKTGYSSDPSIHQQEILPSPLFPL